MRPNTSEPQTQQLFGLPLEQHLNMNHPLNKLAGLMDWIGLTPPWPRTLCPSLGVLPCPSLGGGPAVFATHL
jgi:hypothetical protein